MKILKNKILLGLLATSVLASCLKEKQAILDTGNGNTTNVVEFKNTGDNKSAQDSKYPSYYTDLGSLGLGESATINLNLGYSGIAGAAPQDIEVSLAVDTAALNRYNTDNGTKLEVPADKAIFDFPSKVIIKKGTDMTQAKIKITSTTTFDFAKAYAVPLAITATNLSGAVISGNFGKAVYTFGVRNKFDGVYAYKGYALRAGDANLTGNFSGKEMNLVTSGASSVEFGDLALWGNGVSGIGVGKPSLIIDASAGGATYPVTCTNAFPIKNAPGYNCRYEVATKTFFVSFTWGAGPAARLSTDTLTYLRAR